jgi:subtilase family serine protease
MPAASGVTPAQSRSIPDWQANATAQRVCNDTRPGVANCDALIMTGKIQPNVSGWGPADFQKRYNLPSSGGSGQIVAIVDAYDNPNAANDIAKYRSNFGLSTANFTKYNQTGQTKNYPPGNHNWGLEEDLDIEMVSAACPNCTIYLVEANSNNTSDLETAEAEAVTLGAHVVSNSWGCPGGTSCGITQSYFNKAGVEYLASAGDGGYGTQVPAQLGSVVAVGGTVLSKAGSVYSETTWNGTGSGCATIESKPSWQHDSGCSARTMNDVSAVAWNAAMYDTYGYPGWLTIGGTSVSSPLLGGVFGLAGNASSQNAGKKFWTLTKKQYKKELHDITTGKNGSCSPAYLCTAGTGYDGPTGWGTPNGIKAF